MGRCLEPDLGGQEASVNRWHAADKSLRALTHMLLRRQLMGMQGGSGALW